WREVSGKTGTPTQQTALIASPPAFSLCAVSGGVSCRQRRHQFVDKQQQAPQRNMASTRSEDTPPAATDAKGQLEEKAPVHDASTADHTVPAALQSKTKAHLAKVAQTLREDAAEERDATTTLTLKSSITVVADPPPPPPSSNGTSSESTRPSVAMTTMMPTPTPTPTLKLSSTATPPPSLPTPSPSAASLLLSMPSNERRHHAVAAMEEMRKRAARYRETPKEDTDDLTAQ
ncbi:unnamed protein product, partial [Ectocarpus sp. 12 AP-2014]